MGHESKQRFGAVFLLGLSVVSSRAAPDPNRDPDPPPDLELLEFIAEWQTADGGPLDPAMFDEIEADDPEDAPNGSD